MRLIPNNSLYIQRPIPLSLSPDERSSRQIRKHGDIFSPLYLIYLHQFPLEYFLYSTVAFHLFMERGSPPAMPPAMPGPAACTALAEYSFRGRRSNSLLIRQFTWLKFDLRVIPLKQSFSGPISHMSNMNIYLFSNEKVLFL